MRASFRYLRPNVCGRSSFLKLFLQLVPNELDGLRLLYDQSGKMSAALQPCEQQQTWNAGEHADHEKPRPAGRFSDETRAGREVCAAHSGQRGQQRILRCRVQRVLAKRGEV